MIIDPMMFAAAATIIIGAIATAAVTIINAINSGKKELLQRQAEILHKADKIEGHVNGISTRAADKHDEDTRTILSLKRQLIESEARAVTLAALTAPRRPPPKVTKGSTT